MQFLRKDEGADLIPVPVYLYYGGMTRIVPEGGGRISSMQAKKGTISSFELPLCKAWPKRQELVSEVKALWGFWAVTAQEMLGREGRKDGINVFF